MQKLILLAMVLLLAGCKEKFISPAPDVDSGYLVIEGVLNSGGQTNISLSRTTRLSDTAKKIETGAFVQLEDNHNNFTPIPETFSGNYSIESLQLDTTLTYRLNITTTNKQQYQSAFVHVNNNPPIDSIDWVRDNKGVQLYVNTHDPRNNTRYYQWQFNETWEFHSPFGASLKWLEVPGANNTSSISAVYRDASDPNISICWQFNASSNILLGSSAKLVQDIIHLPLQQIPDNAEKISVLYSVLVKQYSWTKEGYEFLERMKKNTESVGSVFDPQPSELNTNIHCTSDPLQPVIGFFNICTIREKRMFINNNELPDWKYRSGCMQYEVSNVSDSIKAKALGSLPTTPVKLGPRGDIFTFNFSTPICVDCTLTGTNIKPTYWP